MILAIASAFVLGCASSLHCAAMCGPLVSLLQPRALQGAAAYHAGRITTYSILGAMAGATAFSVSIAGVHEWVTLISAFAAFVSTIAASAGRIPRLPSRVCARPAALAMEWIRRRRTHSSFLFGAANGLLPCGMVMLALLTAFMQTNATSGALVMAAFGAGTAPGLWLAATGFARAQRQSSSLWPRVASLVVLAVAMVIAGQKIERRITGHAERAAVSSGHHHR